MSSHSVVMHSAAHIPLCFKIIHRSTNDLTLRASAIFACY
jgi:hypothetical protein